MPVCLHCGELALDGALFCTKCGYTLPQEGLGPVPVPARGAIPVGAPPASRAVPVAPVGPAYVNFSPPTAYAAPAAVVPGAVGPIPPPPSAKYCVKCRTVISQAAVYCPVCQQPQV